MKLSRLVIAALCSALSSFTAHAAWKYETRKDAMRDVKTTFAETNSTNSVAFGFPYGNASHLLLVLRKRSDSPEEVILIISSGQFTCHLGCSIEAKFDSGEIITFNARGPDNGSSASIFIDDSERFVDLVKTSKKLIIEAYFYQSAPKQFSFDLRGLKWKGTKQKPPSNTTDMLDLPPRPSEEVMEPTFTTEDAVTQ